MDSGVPPIGPQDAAAFRSRVERSHTSVGHGADFRVTLSRELEGVPPELEGVPPELEGVPPELRTQVDAASRRWEELRAMDRELRFEQTDGGRVIVEVRDLEGNLVRTVPPSAALAIAAGAPAR